MILQWSFQRVYEVETLKHFQILDKEYLIADMESPNKISHKCK